ncbi:MAG: flotillin family protein, partial [Candidatus Hydrogenedentes bacterium]|nr:flotillin family protein [Candidatus Hydrogenedentota bacterium]
GGNGNGSNTANFIQGMARTLPPMLQVMRDIGGVELPESLIKLSGESTDGKKGDTPAAPEEKKPGAPAKT